MVDTSVNWESLAGGAGIEEVLRTVFNNVHDAIFIHELDGRIVEVNDTMLRLYEVSRADACALSIVEDYSALENPVGLLPDLWSRVIEGIPQVFEWRARRPHDGATFDVEVVLRRLELGGRPRILATVRDISMRKRTERERLRLLASEQEARAAAERAVRQRDEFVSTVSHDLKTPLTAIKMNAELIGRVMRPLREEAASVRQVEHLARMIADSCDKMSYLISDLLDMSRLEAGKLKVLSQRTDLVGVAREVLEMVRCLADGKGITLRETLPAELALHCDRERVVQILQNLVANALKFTPKDGTISLGMDVVDGFARVSVTDTGPGIAPEELSRIFERYWQARHSQVALEGTGLGLAIAKGLVEAHGGRIWAENRKGRGCSFFFTLPVVPLTN